MASKFNTDASWIRKTLRRKSIRELRAAKKKFEKEDAEQKENVDGGDDGQKGDDPGAVEVSKEKPGSRAEKAERRATLKEKKLELRRERRESKRKLEEIRSKKQSLKQGSKVAADLVKQARESTVSQMMEMEVPGPDSNKVATSILRKMNQQKQQNAPNSAREKEKQALFEVTAQTAEKQQEEGGVVAEDVEELDEEEEEEEETESEYDTESVYDTESESEEEEDNSELNELNFNKLLQIRVQTTDHQLEAFCAKYVFVLKTEGVKALHELADDFELVCRQIYEPMLLKNLPKRKKGTLRRKDVQAAKASFKLKIPKEFPVEHENVAQFFNKNGVKFTNEEEKHNVFEGLHILENCCFFQFCLLKNRELIMEQYCHRWEKQREELEGKNFGSLILEEFFMPPMKVEPKLDTELVKFSKLMANRQFEINQFKKKMMQKEPNSVAYNILKNELHKYIKELEEKIKISEIYFAAAIMKVKQKQQKELERIYQLIETEEAD